MKKVWTYLLVGFLSAVVGVAGTLVVTQFVGKNNGVFADAKFESKTFAYDGQSHSLFVTGIPDDVVPEYTGNSQIEIGVYTIYASLSEGGEEKILRATLTIKLGEISGISLSDIELPYNGEPQMIEIAGKLPEGVTVKYFMNNEPFMGVTDVGVYNITAKMTGEYYEELVLSAKLTITLGEFGGYTFGDSTQEYSGSPRVIEVGNLPVGTNVTYTYEGVNAEGNEAIVPGVYTVTAILKCANYRDKTLTATLTITKARITGVTFDNKTVVYNGEPHNMEVVGALPQGVSVVFTDLYGNSFIPQVGLATANRSYLVRAKLIGGDYYEDYQFPDYKYLYIILSSNQIAQVTGLAIGDTTGTAVNLTWNAPAQQSRYRLYAYNSNDELLGTLEQYQDNQYVTQYITATTWNIRGWLLDLRQSAGDYYFKVVAIPRGTSVGSYAESELSAASPIFEHTRAVFPTPQNLKYQNETVTWDAVPGATYYLVNIVLVDDNGDAISTRRGLATVSRTISLAEIKEHGYGAGNYKVGVAATVTISAGQQTSYDSARLSDYAYTQVFAVSE